MQAKLVLAVIGLVVGGLAGWFLQPPPPPDFLIELEFDSSYRGGLISDVVRILVFALIGLGTGLGFGHVADRERAEAVGKGGDAHHAAEDHDHDEDTHDHGELGWMEVARLGVAAFCAAAIWYRFPDVPSPVLNIGDQIYLPFSWFAAVGIFFGGWPIFREAFKDLLRLKMTMELSMTIAIVAGAYTGNFFPVLIIVFFVLLAEILEGMTLERGRRAIRELLDLLPRAVSVRRAGRVSTIDTAELHAGDAVLVAPGSLVPVDGAVIGGHSFVDESRITGESMPVEKVEGGRVYAGSINQSGAIEVRTERVGRDTSYGKIIEAVERAERFKAPIQRLSDRLAGYIVIFALAVAAYVYFRRHDVDMAIAMIIVAGACGIAAGTPLALLGAIGRAARLGAIVKGGVHMETLSRLRTVVLDKTGTLTFGRPEVQRVTPAEGVTAEELMASAVTAELRSEHSLGKAILARGEAMGVPRREPERFDYTPGRGIAAKLAGSTILVGSAAWLREHDVATPALGPPAASSGMSDVLVARDGKFLGTVSISDTVRPEAARAVARLRQMGVRTILLTGDGAAVAASVARQLGIAEFEAELLPEDKVARVAALVAEAEAGVGPFHRRRAVAMVGDGVNDAPALATAHVGVAMGSGTDVARESADVVLLGNDLEKFVDTVAVALRARRIIWFNVIGTIAIDLLGMWSVYVLSVTPLGAVLIHTGSEMAFILNSARLLPSWIPWPRRGPPVDEGTASEPRATRIPALSGSA